jgi:DHA2 family multidrug resistance protein
LYKAVEFFAEILPVMDIVAVVALTLLIINEYFSEHPIVNLKLFKDRTFTSGSTVMFFVW